MKKGLEEYEASDEFKKLKEEQNKEGADDDDIIDKDIGGWTAYVQAAEGIDELCFNWATIAIA